MSILKATVVKCKCGKAANAIKSFRVNKKNVERDKKIVRLVCKHCGLDYKN